MTKKNLYTREEVLAFGARLRAEDRHPTTKTCSACDGDGGGRDYCAECEGTGSRIRSLEDLLDHNSKN